MAIVIALLALIAFVVLLGLVLVGVVSAMIWLFWTVIVALAFAVLGGVAIAALLGGDAPSALAVAGGAAIFVLALGIGNARRRRERRARDARPMVAARVVRPPPRPAPEVKPAAPEPIEADPALAAAWTRLAETADFARSRIGVARSSCARFLALAAHHPDHGDAADFALLIRKHVPEHVDECLAACRHATALEARGLLEEAVADLERLGARADSKRSALLDAGAPGRRRSLLARRLDADDPLA